MAWWKKALLVAALLVGMAFIAAAAIITAMRTDSVVTVTNASHTPLDDLVVHARGMDVELGGLAPGKTLTREFVWEAESGVWLTFSAAGRSRRTEADGYVKDLHCTQSTFVIGHDLDVTAQHRTCSAPSN